MVEPGLLIFTKDGKRYWFPTEQSAFVDLKPARLMLEMAKEGLGKEIVHASAVEVMHDLPIR